MKLKIDLLFGIQHNIYCSLQKQKISPMVDNDLICEILIKYAYKTFNDVFKAQIRTELSI